jgi:hypothetical protein
MLPLGCLPLWGREGVMLITYIRDSEKFEEYRIYIKYFLVS